MGRGKGLEGGPLGTQHPVPLLRPASEIWTIMTVPAPSWADHHFLFLLLPWWFRVQETEIPCEQRLSEKSVHKSSQIMFST